MFLLSLLFPTSLSFNPIPFPLFTATAILTLITLTIFPTLQPGLITLTIFFQTKRFFTITPFQMLILMNLLTKRIRIPIHQHQNRITPLLRILFQIMTSNTITTITSLVDSKTITIQFQTFCFFTVAKYFFCCGVYLGH